MRNSAASKNRRSLLLIGAVAGAMLATSGCSKQAFIVGRNVSAQTAPGNYFIPPKVDFLLVEDDTGGIAEAQAQLKSQFPSFLGDLESRGWDYHFVATALTNTNRDINQVAASRYDSNWGAQWIPPYPGALPTSPGMLTPQFFSPMASYNGFVNSNEINYGLAGGEPGLEGIRDALWNRLPQTGFLRDDAMLVVMMVGNGEDTSLVNLCTRSDGYVTTCETARATPPCGSLDEYSGTVNGANCGTEKLSFDYYKQELGATKVDPSLLKFYSVTSPYKTTSCLGGNAFQGARYQKMATAFNGNNYNVCSQSISSVLSSLGGSLQAQKLSMHTRYLFIEDEPDVSSIEVVRYHNGDPNQSETIPMDATNGWTYEGYLNDVPAVYTLNAIGEQIDLNFASGFAIQLHGTAELVGDDRADVGFKSAGIGDSTSN